ncbi:SDR family oxidoreductase [Streptomyces sp. NPDC005968]|uniref:SDR family oxidoreductase n=1 Tax=unclassified Streptomyces TaxID=2593676 RepID=UPI0033D50635
MHRQGAQVILTDSDPDDLEITARQLGSRVPTIACDLSTIAGIESLIQQIDDRYGYLDLVHTSIEMTRRHDPYALDEQDFDLYVNATLKSTYFLVTRSLSF